MNEDLTSLVGCKRNIAVPREEPRESGFHAVRPGGARDAGTELTCRLWRGRGSHLEPSGMPATLMLRSSHGVMLASMLVQLYVDLCVLSLSSPLPVAYEDKDRGGRCVLRVLPHGG
jgi:hypothetical protein